MPYEDLQTTWKQMNKEEQKKKEVEIAKKKNRNPETQSTYGYIIMHV